MFLEYSVIGKNFEFGSGSTEKRSGSGSDRVRLNYKKMFGSIMKYNRV